MGNLTDRVEQMRERVGNGPVILTEVPMSEIPYFGTVVRQVREGMENPFYLIDRTLGTWVVTAAFRHDGCLLIQPQFKNGVSEVTIELPPGGCGQPVEDDPQLVIAQAADVFTRETGYAYYRSRVEYMGWINVDDQKMRVTLPDGTHRPLKAHLLFAPDIIQVGDPKPKPTEFYEHIWVRPDEFGELIDSPYLVEASARACLEMAFRRYKLL